MQKPVYETHSGSNLNPISISKSICVQSCSSVTKNQLDRCFCFSCFFIITQTLFMMNRARSLISMMMSRPQHVHLAKRVKMVFESFCHFVFVEEISESGLKLLANPPIPSWRTIFLNSWIHWTMVTNYDPRRDGSIHGRQILLQEPKRTLPCLRCIRTNVYCSEPSSKSCSVLKVVKWTGPKSNEYHGLSSPGTGICKRLS